MDKPDKICLCILGDAPGLRLSLLLYVNSTVYHISGLVQYIAVQYITLYFNIFVVNRAPSLYEMSCLICYDVLYIFETLNIFIVPA